MNLNIFSLSWPRCRAIALPLICYSLIFLQISPPFPSVVILGLRDGELWRMDDFACHNSINNQVLSRTCINVKSLYRFMSSRGKNEYIFPLFLCVCVRVSSCQNGASCRLKKLTNSCFMALLERASRTIPQRSIHRTVHAAQLVMTILGLCSRYHIWCHYHRGSFG